MNFTPTLKLTTLLSSFLFIATTLTAQEEKIDTDRPDQTESASIVPAGFLQFEWGINYQTNKINGIKTREFVHPTGLYKYGLTKNFELRVIVEPSTSTIYAFDKTSQTTIAPVLIGFKTSVTEQKGIIPKTSFLAHISVPPLASRSFQKTQPAPMFRFSMQHGLSQKFSLGYNLGMEWDGQSPLPAYIYTLSPGFAFAEKWAAYIEVFGFVRKNDLPEHSIDGGCYFYPNNNMKFDVSAGFGISKAAPDFYVALGYSVRFK
jgi:hypothetical protein